jgi:Ni/Fe-hydrogenase subunit HybB-like protein
MKINFKMMMLVVWLAILVGLIAVGVSSAYQVFTKGLIVTNLTNLVPWGLWITIDLTSIALAAGAFSLCAAVYLIGLKQFEPVARTATFIGFTGYSMAMICLLLDIGRPDRFWHGFVYWNIHSAMWEVTMCVGLYFTVLVIEMLPILGESWLMQKYLPKLGHGLAKVHHAAPVLAIFGLFFSMLHQSSLGAIYAVVAARPIWFRPGIAVLFILSAVVGGIAVTLLGSMLAARLSSKARVDDRLIDQLAKFLGWALLLLLYLRFWDLFAMNYTELPGRSEGIEMLTGGSLAMNFWVGEMFLGLVFPAVVLLTHWMRANPWWRMAALAGVVGGLAAYRWDMVMVGQMIVTTLMPNASAPLYTAYFPSAIEWGTGVGVIAFGLFAFTLGVLLLNVVDHAHVEHEVKEAISIPVGEPSPQPGTD